MLNGDGDGNENGKKKKKSAGLKKPFCCKNERRW